ncbi:MAG: hypothetical protein NTW17_01925 [Candidatus Pacearchaeota archaeon]|nr:hypothetical protein [Candidatus Pacearchaeota archaeon]
MGRQETKHRRALEKIASRPGMLGLDNVISVLIEANLIYDGKLIAQTDVIFEMKEGKVELIEYKNNGNGEERARKQLETAKWWYGRNRKDISPENIHTRIISGTDPQYRELLR